MFGTYCRLGVNVTDSDRVVIRQSLSKVHPKHRRNPAMREQRKQFYRIMLAHHRDARNLYRDVMHGELDGE